MALAAQYRANGIGFGRSGIGFSRSDSGYLASTGDQRLLSYSRKNGAR
jgi:hypothetical protein